MEGDWQDGVAKILGGISIHSLRMEGDVSNLMAMGTSTEFQSTPSVWRETAYL